jgi:hypothetical protein
MLSHHNLAVLGHAIFNSSITILIHITSVVAFAIALYSASVLDLETVACFLALQEIKLEPKKTANPPVDFLSSEHPT